MEKKYLAYYIGTHRSNKISRMLFIQRARVAFATTPTRILRQCYARLYDIFKLELPLRINLYFNFNKYNSYMI